MRYAASFIFLRKLREVRIVEEISSRKLLMKALTTRPSSALVSNIMSFRRNKNGNIKIPHFKFKFPVRKKKQ